jgi:hypothetical protein
MASSCELAWFYASVRGAVTTNKSSTDSSTARTMVGKRSHRQSFRFNSCYLLSSRLLRRRVHIGSSNGHCQEVGLLAFSTSIMTLRLLVCVLYRCWLLVRSFISPSLPLCPFGVRQSLLARLNVVVEQTGGKL